MRYNYPMVEIRIGTNEQGQRLDRFLRKYLPGAPLSLTYKIIRKDVKVNQKRPGSVYMIEDGDIVTLYLDQSKVDEFRGIRSAASGRGSSKAIASGSDTSVGASLNAGRIRKTRRMFRIAYEDDDILIADKPAGLLTHGDSHEKSRHLTNQVQDYLMEKGEYEPGKEKTFAPAPVNRIDRNTSGLVIFAKNYSALKSFNSFIRGREKIRKIYLTVVCGDLTSDLDLTGMIAKDEGRNLSGMIARDEDRNISQMHPEQSHHADGFDESELKVRSAVTHVRPIKSGAIRELGGLKATLAEVEIETGRTHQIRVQLADAGYPLAGDPKYGDPQVNRRLRDKFGLTHQLLTASRLEFGDMEDEYPGLTGKTVEAKLPKVFESVKRSIR